MCLRLLVVQVYAKLRHVGAHHKNTTLASDGGTTEADGRGESRRPRQLAIRPPRPSPVVERPSVDARTRPVVRRPNDGELNTNGSRTDEGANEKE